MQPQLSLTEAIKTRRAARAFRPTPLPDGVLEAIFDLALQSPSGYNLQPWRFIVVKEQAHKEKLKACAFDQPQVSQAPVVLICCGDRRITNPDYIEEMIQLGITTGGVNEKYAEFMRGAIPQLFEYKPSFDSLEAWTNRHTMLAVAYLTIVAKAFGVDSCPMKGFVTAQVKEAFNIPDEVDVCCLLPLGYADKPTKKYGGRFGMDRVCYGESFGEAM